MAEDYVYEDDLNVIFKLIEEGDLQNDEFERQINTAISESGIIYSQLACTSCNKTYKTVRLDKTHKIEASWHIDFTRNSR